MPDGVPPQYGDVHRTSQAVPPKPLSFHGNMAENWRFFKQSFDIYLRASRQNNENNEDKFYKMLNLMGEPGIKIYNTFEFEREADGTDYTKVVEKFDKKFVPTTNVTYERYIFFTQNKKETESYDEYVTKLRKLAESCEFETLKDSLIKDQLILGISDKGIKDRLLREEKLTLARAIEVCRVAETTSRQLESMEKRESPSTSILGAADYDVNLATGRKFHGQAHVRYQPYGGRDKQQSQKNTTSKVSNQGLIRNCSRCGNTHAAKKCPAYGQECRKCHKKNHFANKCAKNVNHVIDETSEEQLEFNNLDLFISNIEEQTNRGWFEDCIIENKINVKFRLDSGADCNILPKSNYDKINSLLNNRLQLQPSRRVLRVVTGHQLKVFGCVKLTIRTKHDNEIGQDAVFYVIECKQPLLGLDTCTKLRVMERSNVNYVKNGAVYNDKVEKIEPVAGVGETHNIFAKNHDIFDGIGCLPEQYKIKLREGAIPKIHPPRKVPFAIQPLLQDELTRLERAGIIKKVVEPTEWVNSMVVVTKKDGRLRICMDPKDLNREIKREHYYIPSIDDIMSQINGSKIFSIVDCSSGFWQIPLDEESSLLCTFNTPFGRYRFLRMPYGLSSAPEVYQNRMRRLFANCPGIGVYIDDILIHGKTIQEHNERLQQVLI